MKSIADNVFGLRVMLADNGMAYEIGTYKEPQTDTINNTQTDCATSLLLNSISFGLLMLLFISYVTAELFNVATTFFCCSLAFSF